MPCFLAEDAGISDEHVREDEFLHISQEGIKEGRVHCFACSAFFSSSFCITSEAHISVNNAKIREILNFLSLSFSFSFPIASEGTKISIFLGAQGTIMKN